MYINLLQNFKTAIFLHPRLFKWIGIFLIALFIFFLIPVPRFKCPVSTVLYDRNNELLGASIASDGQWRFPPSLSVPLKYEKALLCYEDRRYYFHPGIDPFAIARAFWTDLRHMRIISGGSTLTMQTVRLSLSESRRTVPEKILECILALKLGLTHGKKQVLLLYASHAPFGGNVVGLGAASWRFFNRDPGQLSWAESAMLAVLPNAPSLIHPGKNRSVLLKKRNKLLEQMCLRGDIDSFSCVLAIREPLPDRIYPLPHLAPHLLDRINKELKGNSGKMEQSSRSRIVSTLDKKLQLTATDIVNRHSMRLQGNDIRNAAALIVDISTGCVLAYVGNVTDSSTVRNVNGCQVDIITSPRSTGSILKPFLYAGMLDAGEVLPTELIADIPTQMGGFAPQNFSRTFEGAVPANAALARSLNVPAVRMLYNYGVVRFASLLKSTGMTTLFRNADDYGLSLILGGAEGTLWEITGMYAGMARCVNNFFEPSEIAPFTPITWLPHPVVSRAKRLDSPLQPGACWLTLQALLEVSRPGEESAWQEFASQRKIAWKTGTSFGFRDAWAVGVTPSYAVGVWVGNADGEGRPQLTGISCAAPVLFELFSSLECRDWFRCPEASLVRTEVCVSSGFTAGPQCEKRVCILVPPAGRSTPPCPYCKLVHCDSTLSYRVHASCEPMQSICTIKRFILPPSIEWYYKRKHSDYYPLPPWRSDCIASLDTKDNGSISFIYPNNNDVVYVPLELDGKRGRVVFEAASQNTAGVIYWHLDDSYLGATSSIHQMACAPLPGPHTLTIIDENGETAEQHFTVMKKE